jgi:hypothetical protein
MLVLLTAIAVTSCNDDTVKVFMPTYKVEASFSGRVLSIPGEATVQGATFRLEGTTITGTSDSQGVINIAGLTEGSYQLSVSASDHAATRLRFEVAGGGATSGPIHLQRDVYLAQKTGRLRMSLVVAATGQPAGGANVELKDWTLPSGYPYQASDQEVDDPSVPRQVIADSSGVVELSGLPATTGYVTVQPYDSNGDGLPECTEFGTSVILRPNAVVERLVFLSRDYSSVDVVSSNLNGGTLTDPEIFLVYSAVMDTLRQSTQVALTKQYSDTPVPVFFFWASRFRLVIRPTVSVEQGYYRVQVSTRSAAGLPHSWSTNFNWTPGVDPPAGSCSSPVTDFRLSPTADPIDFNSVDVPLEWSALACAGGYRVYARDDRNNPDWVLVQTEPTDYDAGTITTTCRLPDNSTASFDRYRIDGIQTPFAGITVTFCVVPIKAANQRPGGSHATLSVSDVVAPRLTSLYQVGSGRNDTGRSMTLSFRPGLSEFVDPSVAAPSLEIKEAGGDANYTLNPAEGVWRWDAGRSGGEFSFTLSDGVDASGDSVRVVWNGLKDLSGNAVTGPIRSQWARIEGWGNDFDFEGSGQGWTRSGQGWAWGTPAIGPGQAHSGTGCWGTSLSLPFGTSWNTDLTSPYLFVPNDVPVLTFWYCSNVGSSDVCRVQILEAGSTLDLVSYSYNYGDLTWQTANNGSGYSLDAYAGKLIRVRFHFESYSYSYGSYAGFFLDDVRISSPGGSPKEVRLL